MKKFLFSIFLVTLFSCMAFADSPPEIDAPIGKGVIVFVKPSGTMPLTPTYLVIDHSRVVWMESSTYCVVDVENQVNGVIYFGTLAYSILHDSYSYNVPSAFYMYHLQENEILYVKLESYGDFKIITHREFIELLESKPYSEIDGQEI